jgi:hypothetical protein
VNSFTYCWFRHDVKPEWEHPKNKNGGSISFLAHHASDASQGRKDVMDDALLYCVMGTTGENFPGAAAVNGVIVKIKPNVPCRISLWTNTCEEGALRELSGGIRQLLLPVLGDDHAIMRRIEFFSHARQAQETPPSGKYGKGAKGVSPKRAPDFTF